MSKPRFFVDRKVVFSVDITGTDAHHIKNVLRLGVGDVIEVVDADQHMLEVEITQVFTDKITGHVLTTKDRSSDIARVTLFQALPKAQKFDTIIRQTTEIGVAEIIPFISERSVVKIEKGKENTKHDRWQRIANEAAKQSHRHLLPRVSPIRQWSEVASALKEYDQAIVFWEEQNNTLPYEVIDKDAQSIAIVIGPEGGLSEQEVNELISVGARVVTMGESILRVETAAPVALALVMYDLRRLRR